MSDGRESGWRDYIWEQREAEQRRVALLECEALGQHEWANFCSIDGESYEACERCRTKRISNE